MRTQAPKNRLLDARHQNRLASRLRKLRPDQALRHIRRLISIDPKVGLSIANRVLHRREDLEMLLTEGLRNSNESTSRFWIESLGSRLGPVRLLDLIEEGAATDPAIFRRAAYWLPSVVENDEPALQRFVGLKRRLMTKPAQETLFEGLTSWSHALEVRDVRVSAPGIVDARSVYITLQDGNGVSSYLLKKEEAGQLAVDIFTTLANLGDASSQRVLESIFKQWKNEQR